MALDAGGVKVFIRGTDLSTDLQSVALDQVRDEVDATVLASAIRTPQATFARVTLALAGLYNDGAATIGEVFRQAHAADVEPITVLPVGSTVGSRAFPVLANSAGLTMPGQMAPGQVIPVSLRGTGRAPIPLNGVVAFNGPISASGQFTALQLGATAQNQQIIATIHLTALTLSPSVTFFLESDNAVGFPSATIQATSAVTTGLGSVLLQDLGPATDDWWRVRWAFTGTGSFTALISLGLAG